MMYYCSQFLFKWIPYQKQFHITPIKDIMRCIKHILRWKTYREARTLTVCSSDLLAVRWQTKIRFWSVNLKLLVNKYYSCFCETWRFPLSSTVDNVNVVWCVSTLCLWRCATKKHGEHFQNREAIEAAVLDQKHHPVWGPEKYTARSTFIQGFQQ